MLQYIRKMVRHDVPLRLLYHKCWSMLGMLRYGFPAKKLFCIGVTGTDGKTTTVQMLTHILHTQGIAVGMTSTQGFQIGGQKEQNTTHKTTLGRFGLARMLRRISDAGCTHAVLEVSSHALAQHRTWGIAFQRGIATNVSREHLDYHKTMEAYTETKAQLFGEVEKSHGLAILNADDESMNVFAKKSTEEVVWYGVESSTAKLRATKIEMTPTGMQWILVTESNEAHAVQMPLVGLGNVYNALAAIACAETLAIPIGDAVSALASFEGVPGRMETRTLANGVHVVIDYAVTPKALRQLYETVRSFTEGKVIAVLGACGDRDQGKRPEMGSLAATLTDYVVLTDEEPYTEDPEEIIRMLEEGVLGSGKTDQYEKHLDREKGIVAALGRAQAGDTVVISGMGDQDSRVVGTRMIPWSDRGVVEAYAKTIS